MEKRKKLRRPPSPNSPLPPTSRPWIDLPHELTANILLRIGVREILDTAQLVCKTWRNASMDPFLFRVVDMNLSLKESSLTYNYSKMYLQAVIRSQGELIEINIEHFGTDELLHRISTGSNKLKCLKLAHCHKITGKALCKTVEKLPELEELHLYFMPSILATEIETIGNSCPKLKSFSFNDQGYSCPVEDDQPALAIAKSMPNLCHLRLFGNGMTDEGLKAILDCCPKLESLDLRQCFNVFLGGSIGQRCYRQIDVLRCPYDSTADYECEAKVIDNRPFDDPGYFAYLAGMHYISSDSESDSDESSSSSSSGSSSDSSSVESSETVLISTANEEEA